MLAYSSNPSSSFSGPARVHPRKVDPFCPPADEDKSVLPYQDICVVKVLNKAKFPVYLACSKLNKSLMFAMKVFPHQNSKPHRYFENETRFSRLDHPNVIKIVYIENEKAVYYRGDLTQVSIILMEYAPWGDFFDLVNKSCFVQRNNKLVRTYFRQLVEGVEYLHNQGVAHMDLKLENLLVSENYGMKIADFDLSYMKGDRQILARGTKCYRAPEVMRARCVNYSAADVYSMGVILFVMKSGGLMPHSENTLVQGVNFYELLYTDNEQFWTKHHQFQEKYHGDFEPEFRELFNLMTKFKPEERATIQMIKESKWYNGETYTDDELKNLMQNSFIQD